MGDTCFEAKSLPLWVGQKAAYGWPVRFFEKMAKDRKLQMPSSTAGITRYFDDYKSKLSFAPEIVIVFALFVVVLVIFLNLYGGGIFGI